MRFKAPMRVKLWLPILVALGMSACSSIPGLGKDDAKEARRYGSLPNLEVPPAFTAPDASLNTDVPRSATARGEAGKGDRPGVSGVLPRTADVTVEGPPDARWLNVQASAENVWPRLMTFLQMEGYPLKRQDPKLGVMESDWVGKGDNAPEPTGLQGLLKNVTTFFFKPEYQDRIRLRIERGDTDQQTRVFLTSQRMELTEAKTRPIDGKDYEGFTWAPSPENREFDAEMMERLVVFLSGDKEAGKAKMAASLQPRVTFVNDDGKQYLLFEQSLPVAFNRTRAAAERLGFDIVGSSSGESLQLSHPNPRSLYQGIVLRGVELKPTIGSTPVTLTLSFKPLSAAKTQLNMQDIKGDKELPQFSTVVGQQLANQLR